MSLQLGRSHRRLQRRISQLSSTSSIWQAQKGLRRREPQENSRKKVSRSTEVYSHLEMLSLPLLMIKKSKQALHTSLIVIQN